jgi:peptidoglycan/xylan/chitin deacetylase (PgdA/CDA1 family)
VDGIVRPGTVLLMYHRLSDGPFDPEEGDYVLSPALFEAQMRWLAERGRAVVSLAALAESRGEQRAVCLTFDDGCDSDATVAGPLLRSLGFPAAFFVNPARVGDQGRASWDQLQALAGEGFEIGSHGLDHALFDDLAPSELERQLGESKREIEDRLGRRVDALSLPGGSGGGRARRAAHAAGYRLVLGSHPAPLRVPAGAGILPRFAQRRSPGLAGFQATVDLQPLCVLRQQVRYQATRAGRLLLGTRGYAGLRRRQLRAPARRA